MPRVDSDQMVAEAELQQLRQQFSASPSTSLRRVGSGSALSTHGSRMALDDNMFAPGAQQRVT